jgi:hypothetical protein
MSVWMRTLPLPDFAGLSSSLWSDRRAHKGSSGHRHVFSGQAEEIGTAIMSNDGAEGLPGRSARNGFPSLNQRIFAPFKIATVIDAVSGRGMTPETVLARTGLTLSEVRDPHTLTSIGQYLIACENIVAAGAEVADAFAIGSRLHLSAYGMYGYALMCSPTMRDFFDFAVRYQPLATPTVRLEWRPEGDVAVWQFREIYRDVMSSGVRTFLVRQQMKMTFTLRVPIINRCGRCLRCRRIRMRPMTRRRFPVRASTMRRRTSSTTRSASSTRHRNSEIG